MTRGTVVESRRDPYWQAAVLGQTKSGLRIRWTRGALKGREAHVPREYLRRVAP